jgi:hypothetical protein
MPTSRTKKAAGKQSKKPLLNIALDDAQKFKATRERVNAFADAHPRFDELGDLIEAELRLGFDLKTAYRRAELLRPARKRKPAKIMRMVVKRVFKRMKAEARTNSP